MERGQGRSLPGDGVGSVESLGERNVLVEGCAVRTSIRDSAGKKPSRLPWRTRWMVRSRAARLSRCRGRDRQSRFRTHPGQLFFRSEVPAQQVDEHFQCRQGKLIGTEAGLLDGFDLRKIASCWASSSGTSTIQLREQGRKTSSRRLLVRNCVAAARPNTSL